MPTKLAIRAEADKRRQNHCYATCRTTALWAKNEFCLTTMLEIRLLLVLSLDAKMFDSGCDGRVVKEIGYRTGKHRAVEEAFYIWICDMYNKRTKIDGMLIKSKACKLMSLYNERAQPG